MREKFNPSQFTGRSDFQVAQGLYPDVLRGCGVPEESINRNITSLVKNIEAIKKIGGVNDATKTQMAKGRVDVFVGTINALTSPKK
ncbi:MAG: hypothetical protein A3B47_01410 [Candidatus Levybacteria bacterium RIFCSPLOWO2_01_FULL_39_24]|nr:MAG: hypothetical protein A2800_00515 [Candidatus Levybacteria bacterium RIFCSPHIGHO2_01_FULL_40_16]OGH46034.1 MAG: hypothetical protein A3B47_01410 [Candidatus Levybacteria bacterium RIFCSPLOWO2_01_FULL_39_24]